MHARPRVPFLETAHSRVVTALAHVDVVVGVNRLLAAELTAQHLNSAVADDLVNVHVGLCARASLENDEGEVVVQLAGDDLCDKATRSKGDELVSHIL